MSASQFTQEVIDVTSGTEFQNNYKEIVAFFDYIAEGLQEMQAVTLSGISVPQMNFVVKHCNLDEVKKRLYAIREHELLRRMERASQIELEKGNTKATERLLAYLNPTKYDNRAKFDVLMDRQSQRLDEIKVTFASVQEKMAAHREATRQASQDDNPVNAKPSMPDGTIARLARTFMRERAAAGGR